MILFALHSTAWVLGGQACLIHRRTATPPLGPRRRVGLEKQQREAEGRKDLTSRLSPLPVFSSSGTWDEAFSFYRARRTGTEKPSRVPMSFRR